MPEKRPFFWPFTLMACIFYASGQSSLATPDLNFILPTDKLGHFLVFGLERCSSKRTNCDSLWRIRRVAAVLYYRARS